MNKEKIIVILLLATLVLSIGSIIISFGIDSDKLEFKTNQASESSNKGNVELVMIENPDEVTNEIN